MATSQPQRPASGPQRDWLRSRGCTEAQGYFYGSRVPARGVEQMLAAGTARRAG
jgi:hypothetical protein